MTIEADSKAGARAGRRIRLGMVGGGEGAFIGAVHRIAARLDDHYELVAGALASGPARAQRSALALGLAADRSYADYAAMAKAEAARADGIEAVAIVTPNHLHAPVAEAFLKAGIHVICDKPLATTLARSAPPRRRWPRSTAACSRVTYNYTGYPMVRQARQMVQEGRLGEIRVVQVEYAQDWLTEPLEASGQKQADWRTDPGARGRRRLHRRHRHPRVPARRLRQPGCRSASCAPSSAPSSPAAASTTTSQVMLRFAGGARGALWASQVAPGNENNLRLRVYGSRGGLEWQQEQPNQLHWSPFGEPTQTIARATRRRRRRRGAGDAPAGRPSRGLPRGVRDALRRDRAGDPRRPPGRWRRSTPAVQFPGSTMASRASSSSRPRSPSARRGGRWVPPAPLTVPTRCASIETLIDLFIDVMTLTAIRPPHRMSSTATIAEIAARAGVGTATVDRVLNKRPGVNAETVQRVLQAVAEIGAPPQRGRPRRDANFRFAFVLPADETPFLELVDRQIAQSAGDFRHQHITEVTYRLDAADADAVRAPSLAQVADCEGVALMAPDVPPVKLAINELVRSGVHVVTLFSDVAGSMRETHVGADSRAAGRTAGLLLGAHGAAAPPRDTLLLASQATRLSAEIERRIGFAQVLEERFPHAADAAPARPAGRRRRRRGARFARFLQKGIDPARVAGLYNVGSGSAGAGPRARGRRPRRQGRAWPRTT